MKINLINNNNFQKQQNFGMLKPRDNEAKVLFNEIVDSFVPRERQIIKGMVAKIEEMRAKDLNTDILVFRHSAMTNPKAISMTVVDSFGNPISNAEVCFDSKTRYADVILKLDAIDAQASEAEAASLAN